MITQFLAFTIDGKIQKSLIRTTNLKFTLQHGMKNLIYLMDHILYCISDIQDYFEYVLKKHGKKQ